MFTGCWVFLGLLGVCWAIRSSWVFLGVCWATGCSWDAGCTWATGCSWVLWVCAGLLGVLVCSWVCAGLLGVRAGGVSDLADARRALLHRVHLESLRHRFRPVHGHHVPRVVPSTTIVPVQQARLGACVEFFFSGWVKTHYPSQGEELGTRCGTEYYHGT